MSKVFFYNEDCMKTMEKMMSKDYKVDIVLTSPPYNTARTSKTQRSIDNYENRYDIHLDNMTSDEYCIWSVNLFNHFDKILKENGVILYNVSYGSEDPNTVWLMLSDIIENTPFMIGDCIVWKKKTALPNNVSTNKLTRITEFVFVICRKTEFKTFTANKKVTSVNSKGQKYYENIYNFIEAPNNDGSCKLNKATFSSDLCLQLLNIYAKDGMIVYDPFMGTGTTGVACKKFGENMVCIGSELSAAQIEYAKERIKELDEDNQTNI